MRKMVPMRLFPVYLLRLALLVAIAASAALVVEYTNAGDPAFCGVTSGCFAVRISPYSKMFGAPLPSVGLTAYTVLFGLSLVARKRIQHIALAILASVGALVAVWLLWLQKTQIGAFCQWCVAVDTSAIIAAIGAVWTCIKALKDEESVRLPPIGRVTFSWVLAASLGIVLPFFWGRFPVQPPLPAALEPEQAQGIVTIVGFTDFQCPFCRKMHPELRAAVARANGKARLVRRMMPLSGHPGAEPAALAFLCTPEPLKEAVADKLYEALPDQLTPDGAVELAVSAGVDAAMMRGCVKKPETKALLAADKKLFEEVGGRGLPYMFVGKRVVIGFNPERLDSALAQEMSGSQFALPLWLMFFLLADVFLGTIVMTAVMAKRAEKELPSERSKDAPTA